MSVSEEPSSAADAAEMARIGVFGRDDAADRSMFSRPQEMRFGRGEITPADLRRRLEDFLSAMREVISGLPEQVGDWEMSTVTLTAEITAKGSVNLLGTGGELSGKGGMTFTFSRRTVSPGAGPAPP
jgi:hypothetical protein